MLEQYSILQLKFKFIFYKIQTQLKSAKTVKKNSVTVSL